MRMLVTGATGFLGRALLSRLEDAVVLSRDPARARRLLGRDLEAHRWDPSAPPPAAAFRGVEAVFHLAGESVACRWTPSRKALIRDSRVGGTRQLVKTLAALEARPGVLVSASAVGVYGDQGDRILDETSAEGVDFLAGVCRAWEAEALRARALGMRVVTVRIGLVLGPGGGALARMRLPFRLGLGGRLGSGRQWMSWIHLDDLTGLLLHAAGTEGMAGALNAVAPSPATNLAFTYALAGQLGRPAFLPVPAAVLRLALGEMSGMLLASQRAVPRLAERSGYRFLHPDLPGALSACLGGPERV